MSSEVPVRHICTADIKKPPGPVFAGTTFSVRLSLASQEGCDLEGETVIARIGDTEIAHSAVETTINPETQEFVGFYCEFTFPAPTEASTYRFQFETAEHAEVRHELDNCIVHVDVQAHLVKLLCWDEPAAVNGGDLFRFKVGARCLAGCNMAGRSVVVMDDAGVIVQTLTLGQDAWPGTNAVHHADVGVPAGEQPGQRSWRVAFDDIPGEEPHQSESLEVSCRVLPSPECEITVEVVDGDNKAPIAGARVVAHPYRAETNENGIARLKVSKGVYALLVSARRYGALGTTVDITGDYSTRAEMTSDQPWRPLEETA